MAAAHVQNWSAIQLLQIINPDSLSFSCVGHAPSKGRRCLNRIAQHNVVSARNVLQNLPVICTDGPRLRQGLTRLAGLTLCRAYHQGQQDDVSNRWYKTVKREVERRGGRVVEAAPVTPPPVSEHAYADLLREYHRLQQQLDEYLRRQQGTQRDNSSSHGSTDERPEDVRPNIEQPAPSQSSSRTLSRRSSLSQGESAAAGPSRPGAKIHAQEDVSRLEETPREGEARRLEAQRRQDELDRDEERLLEEEIRIQEETRREAEAQRREQARQWEEERRQEARRQSERERQEEMQRRAEQKEREANLRRQQQQAQGAAEQGCNTWADSWARYNRDWTHMSAGRLDTSTLDEDVLDSLPWPVQDGRWQDVSERNVVDFFRHAPDQVHAHGGKPFLLFLRQQALRWHEDRLRHVFKNIAGREDVMGLATVVMQVLNQLMQAVRARM